MDTKEYQLFLHLAESLHFGKTGGAMHMSASAVSRTIKRMEEEIGQQLLERDNRSVNLTATGKKFQAHARQVLGQWESFNERVKHDSQELCGEVSVFCSVTAAYSILSDVLEPFRRRYPEIEIKLRTGDQADAISHLLEGSEDIAITALPEKLPSRLQFQTLSHSPLLFIYPTVDCDVEVRIRESINSGATLPWGELPFIVSERGLARTRLDEWFRAQAIKPQIYSQVSGHEAIVSMVGLGFGIGIVPELVLINSPLKDKVQILDVQPSLTPFAVGLATLNQRLQNPLVKVFWECAKASYQSDF